MKQINWGIIGCGRVTEQKSGPAFQKIKGSNLVVVMRRDEEKAKDYAHRHKVPKWTTDATELINDPGVDAVYVATPPDTHAKYAIETMRAGKPVYVEKPMALNYKESLEMNRVAKETGQKLFVAYYRRALPGFLKVKEWIGSGKIGSVRYVKIHLTNSFMEGDLNPSTLQWRVKPEISGGGYFFDLAPHQLDILDFILGPIARVKGMATNQAGKYPAEDMVIASFQFESGAMGSGTWCFTADPSALEDTMVFVGEKGEITYSTFNPIPVRLLTSEGEQIFSYQNPGNIQLNLIQTIVGELLGQEVKCPSTGLTAARTALIMDQIVEEYYPKK